MTKRKELEREASESWEAFKDANPPKGQAQLYYRDNKEYFQDGYIAGAEATRAKAEKLVEALRVIASNGEGRGIGWTASQHARIAIAEWEGQK